MGDDLFAPKNKSPKWWWKVRESRNSTPKCPKHSGLGIYPLKLIWVFPKIGVFPPKSSILIGFSIINHPFWGTSIFGNTHIAPEIGRNAPQGKDRLPTISFQGRTVSCREGIYFSQIWGRSDEFSAIRCDLYLNQHQECEFPKVPEQVWDVLAQALENLSYNSCCVM